MRGYQLAPGERWLKWQRLIKERESHSAKCADCQREKVDCEFASEIADRERALRHSLDMT